ncbi:MAG: hypothetical protein U0X73_14395 [Thermoanaerobaculia bacterium]
MPGGGIETSTRSARVAGFDGGVREVEIPLVAAPFGAEPTLFEFLNQPELRFLACRGEGENLWLNLDWIAWVELAQPDSEVAFHVAAGARRLAATVELVTGETLAGEVVFVPSAPAGGISELLAGSDRFLLVGNDEGLRLVHRAAIARLRSG